MLQWHHLFSNKPIILPFSLSLFSGLYYKHTMIVNYTSSIVNKLEASLTNDARVIIYDHHVFIVQATGVRIWALNLRIISQLFCSTTVAQPINFKKYFFVVFSLSHSLTLSLSVPLAVFKPSKLGLWVEYHTTVPPGPSIMASGNLVHRIFSQAFPS